MTLARSLVVLLWISPTLLAAERVDYVRDVDPILQKYCAGCHAEEEPEGGLSLESHQGLLAGGDSGAAITPGAAGSSRLLQMVMGKVEPVMPPEGEETPTQLELETLAAWIDQGAVGPEGDLPLKRPLRVPDIELEADVELPVTAIAISPDGRLRAVARYGQVELLREDDTVAATLSKELDKVNSLEFNKDGTQLLVASGVAGAYGSATIFSVESGELIRELVGHRDSVYAARFSPDERLIATAGYDRDILLWDASTGEVMKRLTGHNGAVFDLAFSPDGRVLVSACADETVKVWSVSTGERLDTLSQSEGEVLAVDVTSDGQFIVAACADNYLRAWRLHSVERPAINPLVAARYLDDSPLVRFDMTPDGQALVVLSQAGKLKLIKTGNWRQIATLESLADGASDLFVAPDGKTVAVALTSGQVAHRSLPALATPDRAAARRVEPVYMELPSLAQITEDQLRQTAADAQQRLAVPRGAVVSGAIRAAGEEDSYRWHAGAGEVWAIDADAVDGSRLDPIITILDSEGQRVLRTRLQATRETYFTFRGKNSSQSADYRLFNWQELSLGEYLYAAGEVVRLWMHPRGPDSGFNVYPGQGQRWTYFGTSHATHARGEPAYLVRALAHDESPADNGLPTFDVYYENDDDPMCLAGVNSRLLFTAPTDGEYTVRITDSRGSGGDNFAYRLTIRAAAPTFKPSVQRANCTLRKGAGREFIVRVDRFDGFDGPVTFDLVDLPDAVHANTPLTIEAGQNNAVGTLWVGDEVETWEGKLAPELIARADILGRRVERPVGNVGELTVGDPPSAVPSIQPMDRTTDENENWTLQVRQGETVTARVVVRRKEGFNEEIAFGNEFSGRNATQGVYVDNIGLNGLRILAKENEREFFLTADPTAAPGQRSFFLTAEIDDKVTTHPITVEVLPAGP